MALFKKTVCNLQIKRLTYNSDNSIDKILSEQIRANAKDVVRDLRGSINLNRISLARIFYADYITNREDAGLTVSDISKLMFETEDIHVQSYFDYKVIPVNPVEQYTLEALVAKKEQNRLRKFYLDENFSSRISLNLTTDVPPSLNQIFEEIKMIEKEELLSNTKLKENLDSLRKAADFGLSTITQNYIQFLEKVKGKEREHFVQSLKKRKPELSRFMKLISKATPEKTTELLRLGLDAWGYSMFDILLGQHLQSKLGLNFRLDQNIAQQMTDMIIESQHDKLGSWAIGEYDTAFQVIDTGIVVQLLNLIKMNFPSINIPNDVLLKAKDFVLNSLITAEGATGKVSYCNVKTSVWRQNTLLATLSAFIALYKIGITLGNEPKTIFKETKSQQLLRYVLELKMDNGSFKKAPDVEPDLETTALITKGLFGKYNFHLSLRDIYEMIGIKYNVIKTLGYYQDNWKILFEYMAQSHLNVAADTAHAALDCGAIPTSSPIIDMLLRLSPRMYENLSVVKNSNFWQWFVNPVSQWKTIAMYQTVIKGIGALHEILFCMDLIDDFMHEPEVYWARLADILSTNRI